MSASKSASKSTPVVIKAPKLATAWNAVCSTSAKSENEIVKAIENLSAVMVLESRLSIAEQKKFIKGLEDSGKVSSFIKSSHAPALTTWSKLRALHADFRALPIAKQLSTAMASYDILGVGKGEALKSVDALTKEIATVRKAKTSARKASASVSTDKPAKAKASNLDAIKAFTALVSSLDFASLSDAEAEALSMLQITLEDASIAQA